MSGESDTVLLLGWAAGRSSEATILRQDMAAKGIGAGGLGISGPGSVVAGHLVCRESLLRIVSVAATALCQPEAMFQTSPRRAIAAASQRPQPHSGG